MESIYKIMRWTMSARGLDGELPALLDADDGLKLLFFCSNDMTLKKAYTIISMDFVALILVAALRDGDLVPSAIRPAVPKIHALTQMVK